MRHANNSRGGIGRFVVALVLVSVLSFALAGAQTKYRTFLQTDLAQKKTKAAFGQLLDCAQQAARA